MKYYAYLKQHGEGCDYTIGCGNTIIDFEANSDDDARIQLGKIIMDDYYGDQELSDVKLFKDEIDFNIEQVYSDMNSANDEAEQKMQHLKDIEEFKRLQKKLGKQ
jgi:hypothetical protein